jgi:hypothetical protein
MIIKSGLSFWRYVIFCKNAGYYSPIEMLCNLQSRTIDTRHLEKHKILEND